tara:strand:+ start:138 stop:383 length:246 start_codon:yes stop_codon:yes gene_type:complete
VTQFFQRIYDKITTHSLKNTNEERKRFPMIVSVTNYLRTIVLVNKKELPKIKSTVCAEQVVVSNVVSLKNLVKGDIWQHEL